MKSKIELGDKILISKRDSYDLKFGLLNILLIIIITLKLSKVIDWSWWWILSPIWIPILIILILTIIIVLAEAYNKL